MGIQLKPNTNTFIPIPKKLKAVNCSDFRAISLISHVTKPLLKAILEINNSKIELEISPTQSGLRRRMGAREGIFNLRTINERYLESTKMFIFTLSTMRKLSIE